MTMQNRPARPRPLLQPPAEWPHVHGSRVELLHSIEYRKDPCRILLVLSEGSLEAPYLMRRPLQYPVGSGMITAMSSGMPKGVERRIDDSSVVLNGALIGDSDSQLHCTTI